MDLSAEARAGRSASGGRRRNARRSAATGATKEFDAGKLRLRESQPGAAGAEKKTEEDTASEAIRNSGLIHLLGWCSQALPRGSRPAGRALLDGPLGHEDGGPLSCLPGDCWGWLGRCRSADRNHGRSALSWFSSTWAPPTVGAVPGFLLSALAAGVAIPWSIPAEKAAADGGGLGEGSWQERRRKSGARAAWRARRGPVRRARRAVRQAQEARLTAKAGKRKLG